MENKQLRVFEIRSGEEQHWYADFTMIAALKAHCVLNSISIAEMSDDDSIVEIPDDQWDGYTVMDTEEPAEGEQREPDKTFRQAVEELNGKPDIIATTVDL